jgi:hypothetical protein
MIRRGPGGDIAIGVSGSSPNTASDSAAIELAARLTRARRHPAMAGLVALTLFLMLLFILSNLDIGNNERYAPPQKPRQPFWYRMSSSTGGGDDINGDDSIDDGYDPPPRVSGGGLPVAVPIKSPGTRSPPLPWLPKKPTTRPRPQRPPVDLPTLSESPPEPSESSSSIEIPSIGSDGERNPIVIGRTRAVTLGDFYHKSNKSSSPKCAELFDFAYTSWWAAQSKPFCESRNNDNSESSSSLECRVTRHPRLPGPTGPHTLCDGRQLVVDFAKLVPTLCAKHRPGYFCDGGPTYKEWQRGALSGACTKTPEFHNQQFPVGFPRHIHLSYLFLMLSLISLLCMLRRIICVISLIHSKHKMLMMLS